MSEDRARPRRWRSVRALTVTVALAGAGLAVWLWRGRPVDAPIACTTGTTLPGLDVSSFQDAIDWPRVARAGLRFAFIRLADGADHRDPRFAINWTDAGRAGIARGAYQYFRPDQSVDAQAELLITVLRARGVGELPPVLDLELTAGLPITTVAARARAWLDRVHAALGVEPIVYTGNDLWRAGGAAPLARQPLWLAHHTTACPVVPAAWPRWTFWQHTDHGAVPGIEGAVDLDVFAGGLDELHALR